MLLQFRHLLLQGLDPVPAVEDPEALPEPLPPAGHEPLQKGLPGRDADQEVEVIVHHAPGQHLDPGECSPFFSAKHWSRMSPMGFIISIRSRHSRLFLFWMPPRSVATVVDLTGSRRSVPVQRR